MHQNLRSLLEPESIAVIGASSSEGKAGNSLLENLLHFGYKGKIYPVNPKEKKILGLETFRSVLDIPGTVDVVFIVIPAPNVLEVVKACATKKVKYCVIITAGFKEATEEGGKLQDEIVRVAKDGGMRILGPNCLGYANIHKDLVAAGVPFSVWRKGHTAFIAQSGVLAGAVAKSMVERAESGIGITIGLGNKADLDEVEIADGYLKDDPNTKVICIYSENIKDGRGFVKTMREVTRRKPVIMLKSGRTEAGAKTAFSHTGSLATDDLVTDAAIKQAGILRVDGFQELIDCGKVFDYCPPPRGNRVGVFTMSGASSVLAADLLSRYGLKLATLDAETKARVEKELLPPWQPAKNPLDLWIALAAGSDKVHRVAITSLLECKGVDIVHAILLALPPSYFNVKETFSGLTGMLKEKPLIISVTGDLKGDEWVKTLEDMRIPCFTGMNCVERAAKATGALWEYKIHGERFPYRVKSR